MAKPPVRQTTPKAVAGKSSGAPQASMSPIGNAPKPSVIKAAQPVVAGAMMRKKELIDAVVERSGSKKKDAKPVIEAMLAVLGDAVAEGRELNLQPFGKLKVNRSKDISNGKVMICKLRRSNNSAGSRAENTEASGISSEKTAKEADM